jgi:hypothetical protein
MVNDPTAAFGFDPLRAGSSYAGVAPAVAAAHSDADSDISADGDCDSKFSPCRHRPRWPAPCRRRPL